MTTNITELADNLRGLAEAANRPMSEIGTMEHKRSAMRAMHGALLPDDVLALLDALEAAQAEVTRLTAQNNDFASLYEAEHAELVALDGQLDAALARLAEHEKQEPTIFVSSGQLEKIRSVPDMEPEFGTYLPVRNTESGKFTTPLFAAAGASPQPKRPLKLDISKEWLESKLAGGDDSDCQVGRPCDGPPGCTPSNCLECDDYKTLPTRQPCKGANCGSTDHRLHSAECFAEHAEVVGRPSLSAGDAIALEKAISDFADCGETDVPYPSLMRFANMGLLECTHFDATPAADAIIAAINAKGDGK